jgi:hypothetical protein
MNRDSSSSELLALTRTFVERCANNEFVEVMLDYYDDGVYQVEGNGARREGKQAIVDFEKDFQTKVAAFHGIDIGAIGVASDDGHGNGVTLAEYTIKAEMKDGKKFWPEQVQVTTWKNYKVVALRYYYDPNY